MWKLSFTANRSDGNRRGGKWFARWSIVALTGTVGGIILGNIAAGPLTDERTAATASFSRLSANPDAQNARGEGAAPCLDCPDSYGVGARLRADRDQRMSDEFRELGAVDVDPPLPADPIDDYRYGGRFPDPEPREQGAAPSPDPIAAAPPITDGMPADAIPSPPAE